jgi:hypothetical protein
MLSIVAVAATETVPTADAAGTGCAVPQADATNDAATISETTIRRAE